MSLAGGGQRNTVASLTISMCQRSRTVKAEAHGLRSEPRMTIKRGARCETVASVSTSSCLGSLAMVMEANALRTELRSMSEGGLVQNYCRRIHLLMPELTYAGNRSNVLRSELMLTTEGRSTQLRCQRIRFLYPGSSATVAEARVLRSLPTDKREVSKRLGGELDAKHSPA